MRNNYELIAVFLGNQKLVKKNEVASTVVMNFAPATDIPLRQDNN